MSFSMKKIDFNKMRSIVLFGLLFFLGLVLLYVIRPFFYPIFWAAIIAIFFYPWYRNINVHIRSRELSSFLTICLILLIIFLPLTLIAIMIYYQSVELYTAVAKGLYVTNLQEFVGFLSKTPLAPYVTDIPTDWTRYAANATQTISLFLFRNLTSITQNIVVFVFKLFIMIYTLYYFFKDGGRILKRLRHISPLGDDYEVLLFDRFTSTARATLKGSFIIGGIQGILGGILFTITGIQGALIWGVIMAIFSMIPSVGSFLVWLPAGLIMLLTGHLWQGLTILLVGGLVISLVDNVLRPPMVGKDIQMHPLLILFSTLGGISVFGISGVIIGPVIASLFMAVISIYDYYYQQELENN